MFRALLLLLYFTSVTGAKMSRFLCVDHEHKYSNLITKLKRQIITPQVVSVKYEFRISLHRLTEIL